MTLVQLLPHLSSMAPELYLAQNNNAIHPDTLIDWIKTDYWSLGATIVMLLTKQHLYNFYGLDLLHQEVQTHADLQQVASYLYQYGVSSQFLVKICPQEWMTPNRLMIRYLIGALEPLLRGNPKQRVIYLSQDESFDPNYYHPLVLMPEEFSFDWDWQQQRPWDSTPMEMLGGNRHLTSRKVRISQSKSSHSKSKT